MADTHNPRSSSPHFEHRLENDNLVLTLSGDWLIGRTPVKPSEARSLLNGDSGARPRRVSYETAGLANWDTGLITVLAAIESTATENGIENDVANLPEGAQRLLTLAFAVKEREGARRTTESPGLLESVGLQAGNFAESVHDLLAFMGELWLSLRRLVRGTATFRSSSAWLALQEAGAEALPIVGLIGFLIGMIFAFVGVMQLRDFGAGIYTANLVAVAMVREMAPIMTAIIMAGRTGAAYAAEIGTMKVNEEIDALSTLGIDPIDFLVLPRIMALTLVMPFLTMYASVMGIAGGMFVGLSMLDTTIVQYFNQTADSLELNTLFGGLFKSLVYGSLVALAGTQQGMACGDSAMAVGQATTTAVVRGIVLIVVSASILTIIYINLGI